MKKKILFLFLIISVLFVTLTCTRYQRQVVSLKMPDVYANVKEVMEAKVAAYAYNDSEEAEKAFGFNIRGAGILPVQVIFDNQGTHKFEIVSSQTFLIDKENNIWPVLDKSLAYERLASKTEVAKIGSGAAKGGLLGGAAGAVIGAAIGILTGEDVLKSTGKGAAVGAAAGATIGGAQAMTSGSAEKKISDDLRNRSLESQVIPPKSIAHGFIFFPGEAKSAKELRLQLREVETGEIYSLAFSL